MQADKHDYFHSGEISIFCSEQQKFIKKIKSMNLSSLFLVWKCENVLGTLWYMNLIDVIVVLSLMMLMVTAVRFRIWIESTFQFSYHPRCFFIFYYSSSLGFSNFFQCKPLENAIITLLLSISSADNESTMSMMKMD